MKLVHKFGWFLVSMGIVMVYKINYAFGWRMSAAGSCFKISTACSKVTGYTNVVWNNNGVEETIDFLLDKVEAGTTSGSVCSAGGYLTGCRKDGTTYDYTGEYYNEPVARCLARGGTGICADCPSPGVTKAKSRYYFSDSTYQYFYWCSAYALIGGDDYYGLDNYKIDTAGNTYLCYMRLVDYAEGVMGEVGYIHSCVIPSGVYSDSQGWFKYTDDCYYGN